MSGDSYVSLSSIAQFHQRLPTKSTLHGTGRVWLTKTAKSSAAETGYRLGNPRPWPRSSPTETPCTFLAPLSSECCWSTAAPGVSSAGRP